MINHGRYVVPRVGLPGEVKRAAQPRRAGPVIDQERVPVQQQELLQEIDEVAVHLLVVFTVVPLRGEAQSGANRLVHVKHERRGQVPRKGIRPQGPPPAPVFLHRIEQHRPVLEEEPLHARAARSAVEPDQEGGFVIPVQSLGRDSQPVEQLLVPVLNGREEPREHRRRGDVPLLEHGEVRHQVLLGRTRWRFDGLIAAEVPRVGICAADAVVRPLVPHFSRRQTDSAGGGHTGCGQQRPHRQGLASWDHCCFKVPCLDRYSSLTIRAPTPRLINGRTTSLE
mmetsp:Transcript_7786/g.16505  ORF Transcript_7786/g.16505 Transcript_7786/m.16505 type:complete len:282 (-) Transcript_7786:60-905(-)